MARRTGKCETTEYAGMLRRMIRSYGKRVGQADVEDLAEMMALHAALDAAIAQAVETQRDELGRSWADIAAAAGTSRQAAQMRWGKKAAQS